MFTRSAHRTRLVLTLSALTALAGACSSTGSDSAASTTITGSSIPPTATTQPPTIGGSATTIALQSGIVTVAPAPSQTSPTTVSPTTLAPTGKPTVVSGVVMMIYSNLNFVISDGPVTLQVLMSPTTPVINLNHVAVPRPYIQVANTVQVTGLLAGKNLTAQQVLVPTTKDDQ